jgi:DNA-binding NarL/FixJ family response regulator
MVVESSSKLELVGQATNGIEAVKLCAEVRPDIVLMDLMMPHMNGIEATQLIRAANPEVEVIALTALSDRGQLRDILQAGAVEWIAKDAGVQEMLDAIDRVSKDIPTQTSST